MNFNNVKKDWWLANSILLFIFAASSLLYNFLSGDITRGLISGGIEALVGLGLLYRSKIVFFFALVITFFRLMTFLVGTKTDPQLQIYSIGFLLIVIKSTFILMLLQQIRREGESTKA